GGGEKILAVGECGEGEPPLGVGLGDAHHLRISRIRLGEAHGAAVELASAENMAEPLAAIGGRRDQVDARAGGKDDATVPPAQKCLPGQGRLAMTVNEGRLLRLESRAQALCIRASQTYKQNKD